MVIFQLCHQSSMTFDLIPVEETLKVLAASLSLTQRNNEEWNLCLSLRKQYTKRPSWLPLGAYVQSTWSVWVSIFLFVCLQLAGYEAANERFQRLQNYASLAITTEFRKICRENKRKSQSHWAYLDLSCSLSVYLGGTRRQTKGLYRLPQAIC